jgi:mannosyltransferase
LRWLPVGAPLLALAFAAVPAHRAVCGPAAHHGPDFRAATAIVTAHQRASDGIIYHRAGNWSLRAGMDYHLAGGPAPKDLLLSRSAADVGRLGAAECPDPAPCIGTTSRVWLFSGRREIRRPTRDRWPAY